MAACIFCFHKSDGGTISYELWPTIFCQITGKNEGEICKVIKNKNDDFKKF